MLKSFNFIFGGKMNINVKYLDTDLFKIFLNLGKGFIPSFTMVYVIFYMENKFYHCITTIEII